MPCPKLKVHSTAQLKLEAPAQLSPIETQPSQDEIRKLEDEVFRVELATDAYAERALLYRVLFTLELVAAAFLVRDILVTWIELP